MNLWGRKAFQRIIVLQYSIEILKRYKWSNWKIQKSHCHQLPLLIEISQKYFLASFPELLTHKFNNDWTSSDILKLSFNLFHTSQLVLFCLLCPISLDVHILTVSLRQKSGDYSFLFYFLHLPYLLKHYVLVFLSTALSSLKWWITESHVCRDNFS